MTDQSAKSSNERAEMAAAIEELLQRAPLDWEPIDVHDLRARHQQSLILLTSAGMIERRIDLVLRRVDGRGGWSADLINTGESGFASAIEPLLQAIHHDCSVDHARWTESYGPGASFITASGSQRWRLTDQGTLSRRDLQAGGADREGVFEFVLRDGFHAGRPSVQGEGRMVNFQRLAAPVADPTPVRVTNLGDLKPLIEEAIRAALADSSRTPGVASQPVDGPFGVDGFRWDGYEHRGMTPKTWGLVRFLWNQPDRAADYDELAEPVWGDRNLSEADLATRAPSVASDATKFFGDRRIPWRVTCSRPNRRIALVSTGKNSEKMGQSEISD